MLQHLEKDCNPLTTEDKRRDGNLPSSEKESRAAECRQFDVWDLCVEAENRRIRLQLAPARSPTEGEPAASEAVGHLVRISSSLHRRNARYQKPLRGFRGVGTTCIHLRTRNPHTRLAVEVRRRLAAQSTCPTQSINRDSLSARSAILSRRLPTRGGRASDFRRTSVAPSRPAAPSEASVESTTSAG